MPRRRSILLLLVLLAAWPVAAATVPLVVHADTPLSQALARDFRAAWRDHGAALVADLVPADVALDTVHCYILPGEQFARYFGDRLPDWGVGVALPPGKLVAVDHERISTVGPGPVTVFMHEMTHALLYQAAGAAQLPTWLHEGAAMRASGEWRVADSVAVVLGGHVPSLASLAGAFPRGGAGAQTAYRTSLAAVTFLERRHGPGALPRIVAAARRLGDFERGFEAATGETADRFSREFDGSMRRRFGWVLLLFRWPTMFVILAVLFMVGAVRKLVLARRALARDAAAEDERQARP
ncbi:MAG: hypothetical protein R3D98_12100 [Candidatus Krumholzibacteriia bacterium]